MMVPFYRAHVSRAEVASVRGSLLSGWLTTGPKVKAFEEAMKQRLGVRYAVALNSCTAALHLALEAVGVKRGDKVLVPTMTFAATAEVVRYFDAEPVFVDCEPDTLCMDAAHAVRQTKRHRCKAIVPMHYGGQMCDMFAVREIAHERGLKVVEDAAHTLPAFIRRGRGGGASNRGKLRDESADLRGFVSENSVNSLARGDRWVGPGQLSEVACLSFYANKCITTGEGGMAITNNRRLADRMRLMSLHGMNRDAWNRFTQKGSWYYEIVAPGFKYNMTDIAAALGVEQLKKADSFWRKRRLVAERYASELKGLDAVELPVELPNRLHSWHLYPIRLRLEKVHIDRVRFIGEMKRRGVVCSVHWKPLHMMPYYVKKYGYRPHDFPVAASFWPRLVSLPIFPSMKTSEIDYVVECVTEIVRRHRR